MVRRLLIILVLFPFFARAQKEGKAYVDSLLQLLPRAREDTSKVLLLCNLSSEYRTINPDDGIKYANEALSLAQHLEWKKGIANANSALGVNYQYRSEYPAALEYNFNALKLYEELKDIRGQAIALSNIGNIYLYQNNFDKVVEYYGKAAKLNEAMGNKRGIASNIGNMGIAYFNRHDYAKALEYDLRSLKLAEELRDRNSIAVQSSNIGNVYMYLGDYNKALAYSFHSLTIFNDLGGDTYGAAIDLGNIGETYLAIAKDSLYRFKPDSLIPAGKRANLAKAIEYLQKGIAASRPIAQLDNIIEFSQYLSQAYELEGDYKSALATYKEYAIINDSVYSVQNTQKIKQMENKQALDIKDRDIQIARLAVAKRRNERNFYIAGIVLLLLIIAVVLKNYNNQKKTNAALSREKQRSDDLLLNILPTEVAEELKEKGSAPVKHFDKVTVMFTDFVDFTLAGEEMPPQQLIDELHTCFKAFDQIIGKYNIEKIKTIGDAYLAASGLPVADALHAQHMMKAALEIRDYMQHRRSQLGNATFELRIGIHSGSVVAGIVGVTKFAYDIWGDTVNTAARMEQNSLPGKINISETTYDLIKDSFDCTYRGQIQAKNKGNLSMYFVEGEK
ncbi:MAG: tetratricopeptide repeat protein [Bacteroidetes bacterium]|nr:tetratricopeptide repeat protein [Bacteroidota bacterium]